MTVWRPRDFFVIAIILAPAAIALSLGYWWGHTGTAHWREVAHTATETAAESTDLAEQYATERDVALCAVLPYRQRMESLQRRVVSLEDSVTALTSQTAAASRTIEALTPKPKPRPKPARKPVPIRKTNLSGRVLLGTFETTAYNLTGSTASGVPAGPGKVAVDPRIIPLGTRLYVDGYGECVAADTGGAIKGRIIDVWFPSRAQCLSWGRRGVKVWRLS